MMARPTIPRRTAVLLTAALIASVLVVGPPSQAGPPNAGSAGAAGDAGPPGAVARLEPPAGALPGIDVSPWQNTIDWYQVAASGTRFAFVKATDGRTYVDPMYATNRAGAAAAGIAFGAYHFARPDHGANDALIEADHFVDNALPATGDLLPVLDLESTGGLAPDELTAWMLAWLDEVTLRIGVRPIVYTSPLGWANRTADTTAIVDAGYTVLWVAHWGVTSPTVPANDWQGNGWTFWQYSDCGHVAGIQGCVDADWYDGTTFDAVSVPEPRHDSPARDDRDADRRRGSDDRLVQRDRARGLTIQRRPPPNETPAPTYRRLARACRKMGGPSIAKPARSSQSRCNRTRC